MSKTLKIILVVFGVLALILTITALILKKKENQSAGNVNDFWPLFMVWLRKKEGSKATDKGDLAASNPAPGTGGVHTVRGITWGTFNDLAGELGYQPTVENFLAMADSVTDIYSKIVKRIFNKGLQYSVNPVLATYMGHWYWGGWRQSFITVDQVKNAISKASNSDQALKNLIALRKQYFEKVVQNNPSQAKYLEPWKKRQDDFYKEFSKFV